MNSPLHEPDYRAFVEHLTALRKEMGVTQAALAAKLGKPQSFVSKFERHERRLDPAEFRVIVEALGRDATVEFSAIVRRQP